MTADGKNPSILMSPTHDKKRRSECPRVADREFPERSMSCRSSRPSAPLDFPEYITLWRLVPRPAHLKTSVKPPQKYASTENTR